MLETRYRLSAQASLTLITPDIDSRQGVGWKMPALENNLLAGNVS